MSGRTRPVALDDPLLCWLGAVSLERGDGYVAAWRIPFSRRALFPPDTLRERAAMPAGVRIAFRSDTALVAGTLDPQPDMAPIDLCCDGQLVGSLPLAGRSSFRFDGLPAGEKLVELWLPQFGLFRLRGLELGADASLARHEPRGPRWTTYGSSITQCREAASPTATWPAIVARARGLELTCLGFGGQCHLDAMVARTMRDVPADYLSMCVGINVYGAASLGPRTFLPSIVGFVEILRERHPDAPLAVVSPIYGAHRETTPNAVGFTLPAMRQEVAGAVELLRAAGDRNVHYVDGLRVFGPELAHRLPDDLHPDAEGYRLLAEGFLREVAPLFA